MNIHLTGCDEFEVLGALLSKEWEGIFLLDHLAAQQLMLEASLIRPELIETRIAKHQESIEKQKSVRVDSGKIAHVSLSGPITKHGSSMSSSGSSVLAAKAIRAAGQNPEVKGILFNIDSPGGAWTGTSELNQEVAKWAAVKPVVVAGEGIVASGGYLAATSATEIWMPKWDTVGSLGVYTTIADLSRAYENAGVKIHLVKYGVDKGAGTPGIPVSQDTLEGIQKRVDSIAQMFMEQVAAGRGRDMKAVEAWFTGRTYASADAKDMGLIDQVGGPEEALARLQELITGKVSASVPAPVSSTTRKGPKVMTIPEMIAVCPGYDAGNTAHKAFLFDQSQVADNTEVKVSMAWGNFRLAEKEAAITAAQDEAKAAKDQAAAAQVAADKAKSDAAVSKPGSAPLLHGGESTAKHGSSVEALIAELDERVDAKQKEWPSLDRNKCLQKVCVDDPDFAKQVHAANRAQFA